MVLISKEERDRVRQRERGEVGGVVNGAELVTGGSTFEFVLGDVLVREPLRNTFFGYYLYLLIMREADIPHRSVYILPLGPAVSPVKEM